MTDCGPQHGAQLGGGRSRSALVLTRSDPDGINRICRWLVGVSFIVVCILHIGGLTRLTVIAAPDTHKPQAHKRTDVTPFRNRRGSGGRGWACEEGANIMVLWGHTRACASCFWNALSTPSLVTSRLPHRTVWRLN